MSSLYSLTYWYRVRRNQIDGKMTGGDGHILTNQNMIFMSNICSGLLVSYTTLNKIEKEKEKFSWSFFYFHRFWRWVVHMLDRFHWTRNKMVEISLTTFSNAFHSMKMCEVWLKFHWKRFYWQSTLVQSNGLAPNRRQGIVWINDGFSDVCVRHLN